MNSNIIDRIVWWIPFKQLRNDIRELLEKLLKSKERDSLLLNLQIMSNTYGLDFKGQIGQDIIAYLCLKNKKNGFYIDIGAYDGINLSNTYIFEKLGWDGFCVEASPKTFEELKKNRKCDLYNCAVSSKNIGKAKFLTSTVGVLDVLDTHNTAGHKERIERESDNNMEYIEVYTITFEELMSNYKNINHIDFMSLDIEGGELDVLRSIDFDKYSFGLITVEYNENYNEILELMNSKGYKKLMDNNCDLIFIKNHNIDL